MPWLLPFFDAIETKWGVQLLDNGWIGVRCRKVTTAVFLAVARLERSHGFFVPNEIFLKIFGELDGRHFLHSSGGGGPPRSF